MDLKQIDYFAKVAEAGSFSRAAVALNVSQPVLSRQIQLLEQELGIPLFYRNGRGIMLTDPGQKFLTSTRDILQSLRDIKCEMQAMRHSPTGHVILGIPPMIGDFLTIPLTRTFRADFPKISLQIVEGLSGYVLEWLATGKVDAAILYNAPPKSTILAETLLEDDLCLIGVEAPPGIMGDQMSCKFLEGLPMILPSRPHGLRSLAEQAVAKHGIQLKIEIELDAMRWIVDAVADGLGYTVLPFAAVQRRVETGELLCWRLVDPCIVGTLSLAASNQRPKTPAMKHLLQAIREQVTLLVRDGNWSRLHKDFDEFAAAPKAPPSVAISAIG